MAFLCFFLQMDNTIISLLFGMGGSVVQEQIYE
jgi:hypothetical protein